MNRDLVAWLACPNDSSHRLELDAASTREGVCEDGELRCGACDTSYPIVAGIPRFLPSRLAELQQREKDARELEYGRGEKYESEVERLPEVDAVGDALGDLRGLRVLDAGCGTGETTRILRNAARIVAIDFSAAGLGAQRWEGAGTLDLIQGDVSLLPLGDALFDAAISTGVFHHLPSEEQRSAFLGHLRRTLEPGGRLVLTTFHWGAHCRGRGTPKEGFFDNGIFRRRFETAELRAELARHFAVEAIVPVQIFLPRTYRLVRALGPSAVAWDRFWRKRPFAAAYGNLLLAVSRRSS